MNEEKVFENLKDEDSEKIKAVLDNVNEDGCAVTPSECDEENEDTTHAEDNVDGEEENVNEHKYGKFKNPQELLRAYGELEKEFTRRSQRLRELENGKQAAMSEEGWKAAVDKFFNEIPAAKPFAKEIAGEILSNPELRQNANGLETALVRVLAQKFRTPEQLMQDGQFLNDYVLRSDRVRDAIIADYIDGVREGLPPQTMHRGGMQCVAPKVKPKTIEEAGFMFLKNNK